MFTCCSQNSENNDRIRKLRYAILLFISILCFTKAGFAYDSETRIQVAVDGEIVQLDSAPIRINDRIFVPFRNILNKLGMKDESIMWEPDEQRIVIKDDGTEIMMQNGNVTARVNGADVTLDAAPTIENNVFYIPARFVATVLGEKVIWNEQQQTVFITDVNKFKSNQQMIQQVDAGVAKMDAYTYDMYIADSLNSVDHRVDIKGSINTKNDFGCWWVLPGFLSTDNWNDNMFFVATYKDKFLVKKNNSILKDYLPTEQENISQSLLSAAMNIGVLGSYGTDSFIAGIYNTQDDGSQLIIRSTGIPDINWYEDLTKDILCQVRTELIQDKNTKDIVAATVYYAMNDDNRYPQELIIKANYNVDTYNPPEDVLMQLGVNEDGTLAQQPAFDDKIMGCFKRNKTLDKLPLSIFDSNVRDVTDFLEEKGKYFFDGNIEKISAFLNDCTPQYSDALKKSGLFERIPNEFKFLYSSIQYKDMYKYKNLVFNNNMDQCEVKCYANFAINGDLDQINRFVYQDFKDDTAVLVFNVSLKKVDGKWLFDSVMRDYASMYQDEPSFKEIEQSIIGS